MPCISFWVGAGCGVELGAGIAPGVLVGGAVGPVVGVWLGTARVGKSVSIGVAEAIRATGVSEAERTTGSDPVGKREGDASTSPRAVAVGINRSSSLVGKGVTVGRRAPVWNCVSPRAMANNPATIKNRPTTDTARRLRTTRFSMTRALPRSRCLPSAIQGSPTSPSWNATSIY